MATMMTFAPWELSSLRILPPSPSTTRRLVKPAHCAPIQQQRQEPEGDVAVLCEACNGRGWLLCDFCKGQKTNVKSETNRIYRRCPACRAIGQVLCSKCKVFKCVTFPNYNDGEEFETRKLHVNEQRETVKICQCDFRCLLDVADSDEWFADNEVSWNESFENL